MHRRPFDNHIVSLICSLKINSFMLKCHRTEEEEEEQEQVKLMPK